MDQLQTIILVLEDNDDDYEIIEKTFDDDVLDIQLIRCVDGDEGLDYMYKKGNYAKDKKCEIPSVILLDLNLPGTDGREFLKVVKNDDNLKEIPVLVLTTSNDEVDVESCYKAGANTYIVKPVTFDGFVEAFKRIKDYWLNFAVLPKHK